MEKRKNNNEKPARKRLSLEQKAELIALKDRGERTKELAKKFEIAESSVSTIINVKSRECVKKALLQKINPNAVSLSMNHRKRPVINDVDTVISRYIQENTERGILLTMKYIQQKAVEIFKFLMDPKKNLYTKDGFRINEGKATNPDILGESMGRAYKDTFNEFEGFSAVPSSNVGNKLDEIVNSMCTNVGITMEEMRECDVDYVDDETPIASGFSGTDQVDQNVTNVINNEIVPYEFKASNGWYQRVVRKNLGYRCKRSHGEIQSANKVAADKFRIEFTDFLIKYFDGPEWVYNCDEGAIWYKQLPISGVDNSKKQLGGFKQSKVRSTLLVTANANGDKLKPFLIGFSENPHALRGVDRKNMKCHYRSAKKAWMTADLFWSWYMDYFITELEEKYGEDFDVCLILDNATVHPKEIADYDPRVSVCFLPPNTTPILQPMDQGVIKNVKAYTKQFIYNDLMDNLDNEVSLPGDVNPMAQFYQNLDIYDCINYVGKGWDSVKRETIIHSWHNVLNFEKIKNLPAWKVVVPEKYLSSDVNDVNEDIIEKENEIIVENIVNTIQEKIPTTVEEINELLDFDECEKTPLDFARELIDEKKGGGKKSIEKRKFSSKDLSEMMTKVNELKILMQEKLDDNTDYNFFDKCMGLFIDVEKCIANEFHKTRKFSSNKNDKIYF